MSLLVVISDFIALVTFFGQFESLFLVVSFWLPFFLTIHGCEFLLSFSDCHFSLLIIGWHFFITIFWLSFPDYHF